MKIVFDVCNRVHENWEFIHIYKYVRILSAHDIIKRQSTISGVYYGLYWKLPFPYFW